MTIIIMHLDEESEFNKEHRQFFNKDFQGSSILPYHMFVSRVPCIGEKITFSSHQWIVSDVWHQVYELNDKKSKTYPVDAYVHVKFFLNNESD